MPRGLFGWLKGGRPAPTLAPKAKAPSSSGLAAQPAVRRHGEFAYVPCEPAVVDAVPGSAAALRRLLDGEVERRGELLAEALQGEGALDARDLLKDLTGDVAAVIRQPPAAAQRALAICRDPDSALSQLSSLFEADPALAQSLLRHANSAFYVTRGGPVQSLTDAIQRIGLSGVHGVVMASMVDGLLCRPGGEYDTLVRQIWNHMVRVGPLARTLGGVTRQSAEGCFTLGLLHDVGKLVVFDRLAERRSAARRTLRLPRGFLSALLAELHEPLGGVTALQWGLAPDAAWAIASHHRRLLIVKDDVPSQVLGVAERVDLARTYLEPVDWERAERELRLTISIEACQEAVGSLTSEPHLPQ